MTPVNWLTRREQVVLVMLLGLFIVGWSVKLWREAREPGARIEVTDR
jgi:hypothetical protein